ncbi:hypothetical protein O1W71_16310 [Microbacterium sp. H37-C3]|uniref:hypothetical protein n=1 Tax=Microbacterium sp. H37-C3 TaxID=3004354 RepID=UPI0022AF62C1|nr:hypothetical protein [Microbacterium sp. H37-C3]MCZ4069234.1 hypothetical protein [Microbacterium sp. H37-C3]
MGWGAPLGFSSGKTPFETICAASCGEPGFYLRFRAMPKPGMPHRGRVSFPCGQATFDSPEDAELYLDHPGDVPVAAQFYIDHIREQAPA